jgi:hypothetical protein
MQRRRKPRRESTPRVAVTVRVPLDIEQQRRRLEEKLNVSTPQLFVLALAALEQQTAPVVA